MPRPSVEDFYQNFRFHLIDVSSVTGSGLDMPLTVMSPQIGFQSISSPTMSIETREIRAGNDPFPIVVPMQASTGSITLSRGVYTGESEFYQWVRQTLYGRGVFRRNLYLAQIHPMPRAADKSVARFAEILGYIAGAVAAGQGSISAGLGVGQAGLSLAGASLPDVFARVWKLESCFPTNYTAASGLDATDDGITVAELELHVEHFTEINSGPLPISQGFSGGIGL